MARRIRDWVIIVTIVTLAVLGLVVFVKAAGACRASGGMLVPIGKVPVCVGGR